MRRHWNIPMYFPLVTPLDWNRQILRGFFGCYVEPPNQLLLSATSRIVLKGIYRLLHGANRIQWNLLEEFHSVDIGIMSNSNGIDESWGAHPALCWPWWSVELPSSSRSSLVLILSTLLCVSVVPATDPSSLTHRSHQRVFFDTCSSHVVLVIPTLVAAVLVFLGTEAKASS